ncbi:protein LEO1 homolog isoform X2 [Primulina eburnea]|uniref:protein LEO1 homolog isoform X2 n=1 Tax=Primulina eburnea TaxID=1245227 RepID=UPI003C6C6AC7
MLMHMAQDLTTHIWLNSQINFLQSIFGVLQSKICSEKELRSGIVETDGEVPKKAAEEHDETELKGKEAGNLLVFEIPNYPSLAHPNQMENLDFPNLIAIDPLSFDPATYVEQNLYGEDASGFKRCIPVSNVIRWREVKNPDGTTSETKHHLMHLLKDHLAFLKT